MSTSGIAISKFLDESQLGAVSAAAIMPDNIESFLSIQKSYIGFLFLFPNGSYCFLKNKGNMYRAHSKSKATLERVEFSHNINSGKKEFFKNFGKV